MTNALLLPSIIIITMAFVCYTVGVWSEWFAKRLKAWHVWCFCLGVVADSIGTALMARIGQQEDIHDVFHLITGSVALILMIIHALWAIHVLRRGSERALKTFNRFSLFVWFVWMIPYCAGSLV